MNARARAGAVIVVNAASGTGLGPQRGQALREALAPLGVDAEVIDLGPPLPADDPRPVLIGGGDGTVRALLDDLARTHRPAWHLPWGTANLFAKSLRTNTDDPATIASALLAGHTVDVDIGRVAGRAFACCASTGPDADALTRKSTEDRGILTYVMAFVSAIGHPRLPRLTIEADGEVFLAEQRGAVLVANSSRHVAGVAPVPEASMRDGRLDLAFIPAESGAKLLHWLGELVLTGRLDEQHIPRALVRAGKVTSHDEPLVLQADGELVLSPEDGQQSFEIGIQPGAIRALVRPAGREP